MSKRRMLIALAVIAVVGLVMTGCGVSATPTPAPAPTTAPAAPTQPPPPSPTPVPPTATAFPPSPTPVPPTTTAVPPSPTAAAVSPTAVPQAPTVAPTKAPPSPTKAPQPSPTPTVEVPRPSKEGGPGQAVNLKGDVKNGIAVFNSKAQEKSCATCHGPEGKGGVANPGSTDGTVPALNPIDEALIDKDPKVFAYNLDLFLEHGSTPEGPNPQLVMPAWGDEKKFSAQEIADVIAYLISLNQ